MKITDLKRTFMEQIHHQHLLKSVKEAEKKHDLKRSKNIEVDTEARENRALALNKHEEINKDNMSVRIQEVEKHQGFLKSSLKII
jgi:hypothetical protein